MSSFPHPVPEALLEFLGGRRRFWLATHEHPDNDGFGSMLALGAALEEFGHRVAMIYEGDGPASFRHLPGNERTQRADDVEFTPEALVLLDCHGVDRIGATASHLPKDLPIAAIDHHTETGEGDELGVSWRVESAAATSLLVHSLLRALPAVEIDRRKATCLYAALLTDTGGFRYRNTTADALRAASELVDCGVDAAGVADVFLHRRRPQSLRLLGRVLTEADYRLGGRIVFLRTTQTMLQDTETDLTETEGFVSFFTSAEGVRLVAHFKETPDGRWRVSLRANDHHRVDEIARGFGGGGHRRAAAFVAQGDLDGIEATLLHAFGRELERRDRGA